MIGAGKLTLLYHLVDGREQREEEESLPQNLQSTLSTLSEQLT